jgi:hypothetical protein
MEYIVVYQVPEYRFRGRMRAAVMRSIIVTLPIDLQDWNHRFAGKRYIFTTFCLSKEYFSP